MLDVLKHHFKEFAVFWIAALATLVVYSFTFHYPAISWDDPEMIFRNQDVRHFNIKGFFTNHYVGNYIPLTMLFHGLFYALFKEHEFGYHLVNVLFHIANGFLVFKISRALFKNNFISSVSLIIFLLHPLQTESINWLSEFKNIFYAFWFLLSINAYISYSINTQNKFLYQSVLFFILSCLSKPSAVVLPLVLILVDLLLKQQFNKNKILIKLPWFFIAILFGIINLKTQTADQFINHSHAFPFYDRVINSGFAIANYIVLFVFPVRQSIIYQFPDKSIVTVILGMITLLVTILALYFTFKRDKLNLVFIILFILVNLLLVLQFVPFGEVLNADRYMYVAIIGFAWLLSYFIQLLEKYQKIILPVLLIGLSFLTFSRNQVWKDSISLYSDIIKKYPKNFLALNSLGVEYMMKDNIDQALFYLNQATEFAPNNYKGYYNIALVYLKSNNPKRALENLNLVLNMYDYEKAYIARASAYYSLRDYSKAVENAKTALLKNRFNDKAYFIIGNCNNDENKLDNAISYYDQSIDLNPEEPDYFFKRAIALGKQQKFKECMRDLNRTIELNPQYIEAYYWRGVAKVNLKLNPCDDFRLASESGYELAREALKQFCH